MPRPPRLSPDEVAAGLTRLPAWSGGPDGIERTVEHQIPVNPLFEVGYGSIGCEPCTRPVAPGEDARAGRWAGNSKVECGLHT